MAKGSLTINYEKRSTYATPGRDMIKKSDMNLNGLQFDKKIFRELSEFEKILIGI